MTSPSSSPKHITPDRHKEAGYSLLEILVVMAIIATLAALVGPNLFNQVDKSKLTAAKAQTQTLKVSLDAYRLDAGVYPTQAQGLSVLTSPPEDGGTWFGPYLDGDLPLDPWGNEYVYVAPERDASGRTQSPEVISLGTDGQVGGEGDAADISSRNTR